ncbi:MAG: hypothetical protein ACUVWQ_10880 [Candidatus Aminicenantales bacterium]
MKFKAWINALLLLFLLAGAWGVGPLKWELRQFEDFLQGKLQSLRLLSDGTLSLGSKTEKIPGPEEEFYLSLAVAADGTIYLGTGHNGRVYRMRAGKTELFYQTPEMDVTSLALDAKGVLYAGTSPAGKIYRITGVAQGDAFFNPEEKYIWDLCFSEKGNLLVAVGERGGLYEVTPLGEGKLIFKTEETHVLSISRLKSDELYIGTGSPGRVYYLKLGGKPSLLFETGYEEVKNVVVDSSGLIYVAASGTLRRPQPAEAVSPAVKSVAATEVTITVQPESAEKPAARPFGGGEPGAIFQVSAEGLAKKIWSSSEQMAYSVEFRPEDKKIYFGTGPKGRVYAVEADDKISLVYEEKFEQVYALAAEAGRLFFLGNNPATLGSLLREQALEGEYLSPVLETPTVCSWGRLEWLADVPAGCTLLFQSRSGNSSQPNDTWSDWSPPYQKNGEPILSPKARYLQLRALFKSQTGNTSPLLARVTLFYLPTNLPPRISKLEIFEPNEVFIKPPEQEEAIWGLRRERLKDSASKDEGRVASLIARKTVRKGYRTFRWEAEDPNGDDLLFEVWLRREGEKDWRELVDKWIEPIYVLDVTTFPDGVYELKIVAVDSPSNPVDKELKGEKISQPFLIDNTPPAIKNVSVQIKAAALELGFEAEDSLAAIARAEVLVRPEEWRVVFPVDGITDSPRETFQVKLPLKPEADRTIVIRVEDSHGNVAVFWQKY